MIWIWHGLNKNVELLAQQPQAKRENTLFSLFWKTGMNINSFFFTNVSFFFSNTQTLLPTTQN
jgi:hypothetical protein